MNITKGTDIPTANGPIETFTGSVFVDSIQSPGEDSTLSCAHVRFTPGARTAWHKHPKGQTLYVTDGVGRVGYRNGATIEIRAGDVVRIAPNEDHWHGAAPDHMMQHVAIAEADDSGNVVTWGEHVSDQAYQQS